MNNNESYEHVITVDIENQQVTDEIIIKPQLKCHHYVEVGVFILMATMLIVIVVVLLFNWLMCVTCPSGCLKIV